MDYIMLVCKYGGERLAVESETCRTFESLIERIGEKWSDLHHEELNLFYSTPQLDRFLLKDTVDFSAMLRIGSIFNMKYIEIEVIAPLANNCPMSANSLRSKNKLAIMGDDMATASSGVNSHMPVVVHSTTETPLLSAYWGMGLSNVGQKFHGGRFEFGAAVAKYAIDRGFDVSYTRNDKKYVMACCKSVFVNPDSACPWYVGASACLHNKDHFVIRKFVSYHTWEARLKRDSSKQLSSKLVAGLITKPMSSSNKQWHSNDVIDHLKNNYGQDIDYKKAWSALDTAKEELLGSEANSYQQLWWYTRAAAETNPGSRIVLDLEENTFSFKRIFLAWGACIIGFQFIRPLLFLDGTHLKGKFQGVLLSATGKNANQELYPIAYAVVDAESGENWLWFMEQLRDVVGYERNITFISDRHAGLLESIRFVFPESKNFFCLRHLQDNLRGRYSGKALKSLKNRIVSLFTECARASTQSDFEYCLQELLSEGGKVVECFLKDMPYDKWADAYGGPGRYGEMTSNAAESFNSWIRDARELPITQCIDKLRQKLMQWFVERRDEAAGWTGYICEKMESNLETLISKGRTWIVNNADQYIFEVISMKTYSVNLINRTCSCNTWQLYGFPCAHAVACVNSSRAYHLQDYIDKYWMVESYRKCYEISVMPIPNSMKEQYMYVDDPIILPPKTKRPTGRPKKERFKTKGERENVKLIRCSRCNKFGHHNKKSCKNPINP